jgi:ATP-dependent exoDNAse (exonuclease V) beta subunit
MKNVKYYNAGAGSGKTHKLTEILYQAIDSEGVKPSEVILTTFTKAAAQEIRERARKKLLENQRFEEATQLNNALIGTVHSVAQQLSKKFWHHLKMAVNPAVISEQDDQLILNSAIIDSVNAESESELVDLCYRLGYKNTFGSIDTDRWRGYLKDVIKKSKTYFLDDFDSSKKTSLQEIEAAFGVPDHINLEVSSGDLEGALERIKVVVEGDKASGAKEERLSFLNRYLAIELEENDVLPILKWINSGKITDNHRTNADVHDLAEKAGYYEMKSKGEDLKRFSSLLFESAGKVKSLYNELKQKRKLMDYNDMEFQLSELLGYEIVREEISKRYKLILVDEFQDSSPIQVQIFDKLSQVIERSVWVGDMKQSIYGFRGSDTALINTVVQSIMKGENGCLLINELKHSYRSRPQLVHHVNKMFLPKFIEQGLEEDLIQLEPNRKETKTDFGGSNALIHWGFDSGGRYNKQLKYAHLAHRISELMASKIQIFDKEKNDYRAIEFCDIGVLTHKNTNVGEISNQLRKYNIPVNNINNQFVGSIEISLLSALLKLVDNVTDTLSKAEIMFLTDKSNLEDFISDRMGSLEDVESKKAWGSDHRMINYIIESKNEWRYQSVAEIVEVLIENLHLREEIASWGNESNRTENLVMAKNAARQYEDYCFKLGLGTSIQGYLDYISEYDLSDLKTAIEDNTIDVMTYHRSKGLEWNVVIMDDLSNDGLSEKNIINKEWFGVKVDTPDNLNISDPFKDRQIFLLPHAWGFNEKGIEEVNNVIRNSLRFEKLLEDARKEKIRLMYVAMTRARDYLITTSFKEKEPKFITGLFDGSIGATGAEGTEAGIPTDWYDHGNPDLMVSTYTFTYNNFESEDLQSVTATKYEFPVVKSQDDSLFRNPSNEKSLPCTITLVKDFNTRIGLQHSDQIEMSSLGDLLHHSFLLYFQNSDRPNYLDRVRSLLSEAEYLQYFLDINDVHKAIKNLDGYLQETFGQPLNVYPELPLQVVLDGYHYTGEADLVWETDEGFVLIDYKSYPGAETKLIDSEDEYYAGKYSGQLDAYAQMIEQAVPAKKVIQKLIYYSVSGLVVQLS